MKNILNLLLFVFIYTSLGAQQALPLPRNVLPSYKNGVRTASGTPGRNYWQNTADYVIDVNFDPSTLLLQGTETINYVNNSPDTLQRVVFKLYPNIYKKGAVRLREIEPADAGEGMVIDRLSVSNSQVLTYSFDGTNMNVTVPPIYPGTTVTFKVGFHYIVNNKSHIRTGRITGNTSFVAYFFPRIAVYDDIDGWNKNQYLGAQEFYNDFCNFTTNITVPNNILVWATGDLTNCESVLNEPYCERIKKAESSDKIVNIIDTFDLAQGNITIQNPANTWRFTADNVTDFVFAVSDKYVWQSASVVVDAKTGRRTRTDAVFNPVHKDYYEIAAINRATVKAMSYAMPAWPFPYNHETVFDGLDQMEYPMMVNDNPVDNHFDAVTLTDHEVFHTLFPFYMGINETEYAWMDEGWATLGEWLVSGIIDSTIKDDYGIKSYETYAGTELDVPIITPTTLLDGTSLFLNSYVKPALGYLYIKDYLGEKLFLKALHFYMENWQGKHPIPYDFFNCINTGSGKNLNWFYKKWFFEGGVPDQAIMSVNRKGKSYIVTVQSVGSKPMPVDLTFTFADGATETLHKNIGIWQHGNNTATITFNTGKKLKSINLGSMYIPDVNKTNNVWILK